MSEIPVIDAAPLLARRDREATARALDRACRDHGFFYVKNFGVEPARLAELERLARAFFALPPKEKLAIRMARGGRAWRGYFPVGGELTSGKPDLKEGVYFGAEESVSTRPLQGPNLFPERPAELRRAVLGHLDAMTRLGHALMEGVALGLGLPAEHFAQWLAQPTILFRIFNYPPGDSSSWGVGEHTDYGLLTLLLQDDCGGLEIRTRDGWLAAPPLPGTLVCNIGDMLERLTHGAYRSTPHRVRNASGRDRLSFPFFFDPSWDARLAPLALPSNAAERWDGASVFDFGGTYGEYLLGKVSKVFPELMREVES